MTQLNSELVQDLVQVCAKILDQHGLLQHDALHAALVWDAEMMTDKDSAKHQILTGLIERVSSRKER